MTNNVKRHVQLPRSSQKGKKPTAEDLKYGEIAVNFNVEEPFLAMKGSDDSIITMDFKNGGNSPWKKGEGMYAAILDNGTPTSPNEKVNTATGRYATAEGKATTANKDCTHAEGNMTTASGESSHAEGMESTASGYYSHAEGKSTTASGETSHAEGGKTTARGGYSHSEGFHTTASGDTSHAEGNYTTVNGTNSHGEGNYKQELKLVKDISIGDTKIFINFQEMSIIANDDYIKNCYIVNNDKSYKIKGYEVSYDFTSTALELTLDKPLEKASTNDNPTEETFISEEYKFINIAVEDVDAGHSEGKYNMVLGESGHAEGKCNIAIGNGSHVEGKNNIAEGINSHAEGLATAAFGKYAHSEGTGTMASGDTSHAECFNTKALGECSHAEGYYTTASGDYSHAEGKNNMAKGTNSHAEGSSNTASGENAHAEGISTIASGDTSHSEGRFTKALGGLSHAEGDYAIAMGDTSHAEGYETNAAGMYSHVEGKGSIALGNATHVEGLHRQAMNFTDDVTIGATEIFILASEDYSVNLDYYKNCLIKGGGVSIDVISAEYAYNTKFTSSNENKRIKLTLKEALPKACTRAEQTADNQKDGYFSTQDYQIHNKGTIENYGGHAEGSYTMVYDDSGHAEGKLSIAKGKMSHAEGYRTIADGSAAHSEGYQTIAKGVNSHAEGENTTANGNNSHASGFHTTVENDSEFACGKYNKFNVNQIFSIGVGTADNARKNALYVTTDGVIGGDSQLTNGGTSMFGLKINGGIEATNGMISPTYLNSSDERLKKNIETISEDDIDKVKNIDLKSYVFKSDNSKHYGVIAQDVEKVGLSELVTNGADGMKSVDYISLLILKIAELENEIKNLKEHINK